MERFLVGQLAFVRARLTDPATGEAADPATQDPVDDPTISVDVYKPDRTLLSPVVSLARSSVGTYIGTFTPDADGEWEAVTTATGPAAGRGRVRFLVMAVPS